MLGITEILLLVVTLVFLAYLYVRYHFSYWNRKNVKSIKPHFLFGNLKEMVLMKKTAAHVLTDWYNSKEAENQPYVGVHIFHQPGLLLRNLDLIKQVLIKDFNKFSNRFTRISPHDDPLGSYNLFLVRNPLWRQIRMKLTPVFTSGKMKQMFYLVDEIGSNLNEHLLQLKLEKLGGTATCQELKELCALYTTDVIASVAYGLNANSIKNPNGEFRRNGRKIFTFNLRRAIDFTAFFFIPNLIPIVKATFFTKESSHFLRSTIGYVMKEREESGSFRNDLIDILLTFKKETDDSGFKFTQDMLVAQAGVFFTAGYETSSSAMSFALYEMSKQPLVQKRLRQEIKDTLLKNNGKVTYDSVSSMEYLNMVLQEVLRMYPPLPFLDRQCSLEKQNGAATVYSLKPYGNLEIPDGMPVYIPIYAIQRDAKYFPEPNTFNPERFSSENKGNLVPASNMPFGMGPHNCIGERFGIMQAKIGLVYFLKNHYVKANEKTHKEMVLDPMALIIASKGGIYCDIVRDPLMD